MRGEKCMMTFCSYDFSAGWFVILKTKLGFVFISPENQDMLPLCLVYYILQTTALLQLDWPSHWSSPDHSLILASTHIFSNCGVSLWKWSPARMWVSRKMYRRRCHTCVKIWMRLNSPENNLEPWNRLWIVFLWLSKRPLRSHLHLLETDV